VAESLGTSQFRGARGIFAVFANAGASVEISVLFQIDVSRFRSPLRRRLRRRWGKDTLLQRALTVLLPVRDAQSTLADTVAQVLDLAAEVSERFEVLIIDDASSDATNEIAHDLRRCYPQIRVLRHRKPLGEDAALRMALSQIRGDVLCVKRGRRPALQPYSARLSPARPNYLIRASQLLNEVR
jgi:cellulose synthase/poly-beta-1,6-N-acetylglucosamine synthase-like glycosyltransferase